ncbi:MAG: hypothetical protein V4549_12600 [Bacteroidota bacterium]
MAKQNNPKNFIPGKKLPEVKKVSEEIDPKNVPEETDARVSEVMDRKQRIISLFKEKGAREHLRSVINKTKTDEQ